MKAAPSRIAVQLRAYPNPWNTETPGSSLASDPGLQQENGMSNGDTDP